MLQCVQKLDMDFTHFLALVLICQNVLTSQSVAWDASARSSSVITWNHRRLKGSTFKSFHSVSLVSCSLQCQRHWPRCISANFRKASSLDETEGICELNERGIESPKDENEGLEFEEGAVYAQFQDMKVS